MNIIKWDLPKVWSCLPICIVGFPIPFVMVSDQFQFRQSSYDGNGNASGGTKSLLIEVVQAKEERDN